MLPEWMQSKENYEPPAGGGSFVVKTIQTLGGIMSRVKIQKGHEKKRALPAIVKLAVLIVLIILTAASRSRLLPLAVAAAVLVYLCTWPPRDLWQILKTAGAAGLFTLILFVPAMIWHPSGIPNHLNVAGRVFLCMAMVCIFNHTTQWNHITSALRRLHVPGLFVFILDITLKYIVLLGNLIQDLLTAMQLRAVGRHDRKYASVGGVMGITFLRGMELNEQMYEAMRCRGFTDDYRGL